MIQALFFDIDGTLVSFRTHTAPDSVRQALPRLRQRGIKLFIATGRPLTNLEVLKRCFDFDFDGIVAMNGQYCFCGDEVIHRRTLPHEGVRQAVAYMDRQRIPCAFVEEERVYYNFITDEVRRVHAMLDQPLTDLQEADVTRAHERAIYQVSALIPAADEPAFFAHMPGCRAARWHPDYMDVIPADGGKPVGIAAMLAHFGLKRENAMVFGDGGNDIDMLRYAGIGVAMGNALDETKAAADYVTDAVDDDGVVKALRHFELL